MTIILLLLVCFALMTLFGPRVLAIIILTPAALWLLLWAWIIAYNF